MTNLWSFKFKFWKMRCLIWVVVSDWWLKLCVMILAQQCGAQVKRVNSQRFGKIWSSLENVSNHGLFGITLYPVPHDILISPITKSHDFSFIKQAQPFFRPTFQDQTYKQRMRMNEWHIFFWCSSSLHTRITHFQFWLLFHATLHL